MTTVAALNAIMRMDASSFATGLGSAQAALSGFEAKVNSTSQNMSAIGAGMTKAITMPVAAIGAAAIYTGLQFEESMTNMAALVGVAAEPLAEMRAEVLKMGPELGKGPKELGDALYYVSSAGFEGAEAMNIMETAAKASAAGMGSTETMADALTSAMSAYKTSGLTAATATDVLVAAVREGKAEPEAFAATLGKVIPIASSMGVKFEEVAGVLAVMSRSGMDAAEGTTALRGMMSQLLQPSEKAREAFKLLNMNADGLRQMLGEQGLLPVLRMMQQGFEGNSEAMSAVFGDVRGLTGVMNVLGQDAAGVDAVMRGVAESTGDAGKAFDVVAATDGFKMKQALAQIQVSLVQVSDVILPVVATLAGGVANLTDKFSALPAPVQQAAITFLAVAAGAGPVLSMFGSIGTLAHKLAPVFPTVAAGAQKLTSAMPNLASALGGVGAAAAVGAAGFLVWKANAESMRNEGQKFVDESLKVLNAEFKQGGIGIEQAAENMKGWNQRIGENGREMDNAGLMNIAYKNQLTGVNEGLKKNIDAMQPVFNMAQDMTKVTGQSADAYFRWLSTVEGGPTKFGNAENAIKAFNAASLESTGMSKDQAKAVAELGGAYVDETVATQNAVAALKEWSDTLKAQFDPVFAFIDAQSGLTTAQVTLRNAQSDLAKAQLEHGYASQEAVTATVALTTAEVGLMQANVDLDMAARNLAQGVRDGTVPMAEASAAVDRWAASGRITSAQAEQMRVDILNAAGAANAIDGTFAQVTVGADTSQAMNAIKQVSDATLALFGLKPSGQPSTTGGGMLSLYSNLPKAAAGGVTKGWTLAGEAGPELILPMGDAARSQQLLAQHGSFMGFKSAWDPLDRDAGWAKAASEFAGAYDQNRGSRGTTAAQGDGQTLEATINVIVDGENITTSMQRRELSIR